MKGYFYLSILALLFTPAVGVAELFCYGEQATCESGSAFKMGQCAVSQVYCDGADDNLSCNFICDVCKQGTPPLRLKALRGGCQNDTSSITFDIQGGEKYLKFNDNKGLKNWIERCCSNATTDRADEQDNQDFTSY